MTQPHWRGDHAIAARPLESYLKERLSRGGGPKPVVSMNALRLEKVLLRANYRPSLARRRSVDKTKHGVVDAARRPPGRRPNLNLRHQLIQRDAHRRVEYLRLRGERIAGASTCPGRHAGSDRR